MEKVRSIRLFHIKGYGRARRSNLSFKRFLNDFKAKRCTLLRKNFIKIWGFSIDFFLLLYNEDRRFMFLL